MDSGTEDNVSLRSNFSDDGLTSTLSDDSLDMLSSPTFNAVASRASNSDGLEYQEDWAFQKLASLNSEDSDFDNISVKSTGSLTLSNQPKPMFNTSEIPSKPASLSNDIEQLTSAGWAECESSSPSSSPERSPGSHLTAYHKEL